MLQNQAVDGGPPDIGLAAGAEASCFERILRPTTAMAIWRRSLDPRLTQWLDGLAPEDLPHKRFVAARLMVAEVLEAACASLPASPQKSALIADVANLVERFSDIMVASTLRVRLEAIDGNACRRFHQDAVDARLLCTYRGPATEYGFAEPGEEPEEIQALQRGDAAICKGSQWPDAPPHNLLHRSPPIAGTGLSRLLLVVDVAAPADAEEDEEWAAHLRPRQVQ